MASSLPTSIPGVLTLHPPAEPAAPLVLDSPHSGHLYPQDFTALPPLERLRRAEDMYVEELFGDAPRAGAALLEAHFPRSYVDPNRPESDLDPELIDGEPPIPIAPGVKTRLGVGLIWSRVPPEGGPMYAAKLSPAEVLARIETYHRPYHAALRAMIAHTQERFGAVWHLDCHSMPAVSTEMSPEGADQERPEINLGDRDGTTCEAAFTHRVAEAFSARGYEVAINRPYKGVELVRAHSDPAQGRHSLQVEINRKLYMDEASFERLPRFARLRIDLARIIEELAAWTRARL